MLDLENVQTGGYTSCNVLLENDYYVDYYETLEDSTREEKFQLDII